MSTAPKTRREVEQALLMKALKDPVFRQQMLSNPGTAVEQELKTQLPAGLRIVVHEETPTELHLVLPALPKPAGDLSDAELEAVAVGAGAADCKWQSVYSACSGRIKEC